MSTEPKGWIGVDLDGTLAHYEKWNGADHIGLPVAPMLTRVRKWLAEGRTVKCFTARAADPKNIPPVRKWLDDLGLQAVEITNSKDFETAEIWDDRAVQVFPNKGVPVDTVFAYQLKRIVDVIGVKVVDGLGYEQAVDQALRRIGPKMRALDDVRALVDGAADAIGHEVKSQDNASRDLRRAHVTLTKALKILEGQS